LQEVREQLRLQQDLSRSWEKEQNQPMFHFARQFPSIVTADEEKHWTKLRRELATWFNDRAPSFVEGYIGAVHLLYCPTFPARVHFICHAVRDIYHRLPGQLESKSLSRPAEVFLPLVRSLVELWGKYPSKPLETPNSNGHKFTISPEVYTLLEDISQKSKQMGHTPRVGQHLAKALFQSQDRCTGDFIPQWVTNSFDTEYNYFVGRAHLDAKPARTPNEDDLTKHFESFERSFHSLVGPYFSGKEELDAILQATNLQSD
jgi:hypothetical protein